MPRPLAVLVLVLIAAGVACAEDSATAPLLKKANVRFGADTSAPVAGTLDAGTAVEVLGPAKQGWLMIRFPRGCTAWMHQKVLQPVGTDGKQFKVIEDKARVRADSTLGSAIVAEVGAGDVVEATGKQNGQWFSVYPPNAVAYVAAQYVDRTNLPVALGGIGGAVAQVDRPGTGEKTDASTAPTPVDDYVARLWKRAQDTYAQYKDVANVDNAKAMALDWPGLSDQLGQVVEQHRNAAIRMQASRLKTGVDRVAEAQRKAGQHPVVTAPEPEPAPAGAVPRQAPPVVAKSDRPKADPAKATAPKTDAPTKADAPAKADTKAPAPANPDDAKIAAAQDGVTKAAAAAVKDDAAKAAATGDIAKADGAKTADSAPAKTGDGVGALLAPGGTAFTVEGWLEQRDTPDVAATHVLIDANSHVVAYLKPKAGASLQLSEYFWRLVTASGEKSGEHDGAPVLVIDQVSLPGR